MNIRWSGLAPLLIIVLVGGVVWFSHFRDKAERPPVALTCPDIHAGCAGELAGRPVQVGVRGDLKVLHPFEVWVRAADVREAHVSFAMEGMDMGFNLYTLRPDQDGVLRGRVTLPVCVSGRRDWRMTLEIEGQRLTLPFVTEL